MKSELVWLTEERHYATMLSPGAYVSLIEYSRGGIKYEVFIDNDEFEYIEGENSDDAED